MVLHNKLITVLLLAWLGQLTAFGQTLPSFEKAAEQAQAATVTVRIGNAVATEEVGESSDDEGRLPVITVFSGVSLGDGLLVSPLFAAKDARIRVTIAGGEQAKAKPLVLDQFCGLALLEMDRKDVPTIPRATALPKVGSWVISAAGWGVEKPVVSFGMVSGVDRTLPGGNFPPVLQCNLTTVESSSGAGVVDQEGKLVGVIVAADAPSRQRGWAYAVPVKHIERLIRARRETPTRNHSPQPSPEDDDDGSVIVLQSRRPRVGMVLDGNADDITVSQVEKNGPADKAGICVGDKVLAVDGIKIRSVYQATRPTWTKQPGDTVTFFVHQKAGPRAVEVVLGGGVAVPGVEVGNLIQPKIQLGGVIAAENTNPLARPRFGDVSANVAVPLAELPPDQLLKLAVDRYQDVIKLQRGQLLKQDRELSETIKRYKAAEDENRRLKTHLDSLHQENPR